MHGARLKKTSHCAHRAETQEPRNCAKGRVQRRPSSTGTRLARYWVHGFEETSMSRKTWIVTVAALAAAAAWIAPASDAHAQPHRDRDHDRAQVRARIS